MLDAYNITKRNEGGCVAFLSFPVAGAILLDLSIGGKGHIGYLLLKYVVDERTFFLTAQFRNVTIMEQIVAFLLVELYISYYMVSGIERSHTIQGFLNVRLWRCLPFEVPTRFGQDILDEIFVQFDE